MAGCMPRARGAQGRSPNVAWSLPWKHCELQPQRRLLTLRAMKSILWLVPLCILVACGSDKSGQTVNRDTLTERQKDSRMQSGTSQRIDFIARNVDRKSTRLNSSHSSI